MHKDLSFPVTDSRLEDEVVTWKTGQNTVMLQKQLKPIELGMLCIQFCKSKT